MLFNKPCLVFTWDCACYVSLNDIKKKTKYHRLVRSLHEILSCRCGTVFVCSSQIIFNYKMPKDILFLPSYIIFQWFGINTCICTIQRYYEFLKTYNLISRFIYALNIPHTRMRSYFIKLRKNSIIIRRYWYTPNITAAFSN